MAEWTTKGTIDKISPPSAIATVDEAEEFTIPSYFRSGEFGEAKIDLSVSGTFAATISLQRSFDGSAWHTVEEYTVPTEKIIENPTQTVKWRLGIDTGNWTSGSAVVRLSQT